MAEEKRLIGDDGRLARGSLATSHVTTFAYGNWYKIKAKAATNSVFGDLAVGEFFFAADTIVGQSGDEAYLLTLTTMADLSGWSLEFTADEVEVTVLADIVKKYRKGKSDASGTASFVFIKGITDQDGGFANYFVDIVELSASGGTSTVTKHAKKTDALYLVGYMAEEGAGEVTLATVIQIELFNMPINMNSSEPVNMESPFRLVGDLDPIFYRITNT